MASVSPRVNRDGSVTWRVNYRIGSKQVQDSFPLEKGAEGFRKKVDQLGGARARAWLDAKERGEPESPTLTEFAIRYLDIDSGMLTGISAGTRAGYVSIVNRSFMKSGLGEMPIDAVTRDDIGRWVGWQQKQPSGRTKDAFVSAKTIHNYHALLSAVFTAAMAAKLITENPARGTRLPEGDRREGVFLTVAEFDRILAQIPARHKAFVRLLVATGCRWGEATALTWGDLDVMSDPPTVRINKAWKKGPNTSPVLGPPKSKKARRTVSIWPEIVDALGDAGNPEDLIFPNETGGHLWHSHFNTRVWKPAISRAKILKTPNPHDLRHTSASWMIQRGVPLPYIQARLGHEKIETTVGVYGHLLPEAHREMANVMRSAMVGDVQLELR